MCPPEENQTPNPSTPPAKPPTPPVEGDDKVVPIESYNGVKADMHRFKAEKQKLEDELKAVKEKEMKEKDQWKEFGTTKEKEANDWKQKHDQLHNNLFEGAKLSKVKEEAIKLGLREEAVDDLELMDFKDVVVETTSRGKINVHGAKSAAEKIKQTKPHWFTAPGAPNINNRQPGVNANGDGGATKVTIADMNKAELAAQKSGDYTEYKKLVVQFKTQK